jgi:hypothetical protein
VSPLLVVDPGSIKSPASLLTVVADRNRDQNGGRSVDAVRGTEAIAGPKLSAVFFVRGRSQGARPRVLRAPSRCTPPRLTIPSGPRSLQSVARMPVLAGLALSAKARATDCKRTGSGGQSTTFVTAGRFGRERADPRLILTLPVIKEWIDGRRSVLPRRMPSRFAARCSGDPRTAHRPSLAVRALPVLGAAAALDRRPEVAVKAAQTAGACWRR